MTIENIDDENDPVKKKFDKMANKGINGSNIASLKQKQVYPNRDKPCLADTVHHITDFINRDPVYNNLGTPEFEKCFEVTETLTPGVKKVLEVNEDDMTARIVSDAYVGNCVWDFCSRYKELIAANWPKHLVFHQNTRNIPHAISLWIAACPAADEPRTVAFKATENDFLNRKLAYQRMPFTESDLFSSMTHFAEAKSFEESIAMLKASGKAPHWVNLIERMGNAHAFCTFVWSLFDDKSDCSQYVYIYGKGGDGKSSLINAIGRSFGSAYLVASQKHFSNRFFAHEFLGKRLVYVSEADPKFPGTDLFKSISGEHKLLVEEKGKPFYLASHKCKFIFASNLPIQLSTNRADLRRVIYCPIEEYTGPIIPTEIFENLLASEFQHFLAMCRWAFILNGGYTIKADTSEVEDLSAENNADAIAFFHRHFTVSGEHYTKAHVYQILLKENGLNNNQIHTYYDLWEKQLGVSFRLVQVNGKRFRAGVGFKPNNGIPEQDYGRLP